MSLFIQPQTQASLEGQEGLTSVQIAESLGVQHQHAARKIRQFTERLQISVRTRAEKSEAGRNSIVYILPTELAKMVVAKYDNERGLGYLKFLLECERVATELTPKLVARVKELEAELKNVQAKLSGKNVKALPKPKTSLITEQITRYENLFGEEAYERVLVRTPNSSLTEIEVMKARHTMLVLQAEGVLHSIAKLKNKIDFLEQHPKDRLTLIKGD